ncbi:reverse transcriptase [Plakobranchus ocellatus]|uniref:Reverse transcriptase n=1 Tax=Plakobranchus ocellatus TaxID=259542 RepID=A0AAV3YP68_9GAST|nr:reverse transcriptase [Plakobranchus ocellatus]
MDCPLTSGNRPEDVRERPKDSWKDSAEESQAENRDDVLRHPSSDKRQKINFSPASSGKQWEDLDSKIVLKIDSLLGKSTLEHKLAIFGDIVYQTCLDTFGKKQHQTKCPPQRSRRQLEMDTLRKQKRKLKKQIRAASSEETNGLLAIWRQLKARHSALSRTESARKKRSQMRKNQERFIRDPFQFARQLFQQPKSGTLTVEREELETHLKKKYSDPTREIPLEETTGLIWCLQFMLIPKLLWPLLVYDICSSAVEAIEAKTNKYTRKWLGVPPGLSDVAMYCRKAKLKLLMKSNLEEYKCGKARLLTMLEESDDPVVKTVQPSLKTGRKWKP